MDLKVILEDEIDPTECGVKNPTNNSAILPHFANVNNSAYRTSQKVAFTCVQDSSATRSEAEGQDGIERLCRNNVGQN